MFYQCFAEPKRGASLAVLSTPTTLAWVPSGAQGCDGVAHLLLRGPRHSCVGRVCQVLCPALCSQVESGTYNLQPLVLSYSAQ